MSAARSTRTDVARLLALGLSAATFGLATLPCVAADSISIPREQGPKVQRVASPVPVSGRLRILLVDDDGSYNNSIPGDKRNSVSDTVFRNLVSNAVGGDGASWATEVVRTHASGPSIEKLRDYSLIVWYTGASYGGNPDNTSVLSVADEKTVRRYLEETGGAVILISPGYVSKVLEQGSTWEQSSWPFLNEVLGIRGGKGLAQRFKAGTVSTTRGMQFQVGKGGPVESQFSAVNPRGASVVFTAALSDMKNAGEVTPVATANSYGRGRIVYVGFTLENLVAQDLAPAFNQLLSASNVAMASAALSATLVTDAPKTFAVTGSGRDSFNFAASSPGAIRVQVQSRGVPVTVAVLHPDGRKVEHSGSGGFVFDDLASDADIAKGHIWGVSVRATTPTAATAVAASGSVTVSHPPSNEAAVQTQLDTLPSRTQVLKTARTSSATLKPDSISTPIASAPAPAPAPTMVFNREAKDRTRSAQPAPPPPPLSPLAGPDPVLRLDKLSGTPGTPLKASGKDLFPPGTRVKLVMDKWGGPDYYNAELHFVYGGQPIISPMKAVEIRYSTAHPNETETDPEILYIPVPLTGYFTTVPARDLYERWYTGVVPNIPVTGNTVVSVYLKTKDGRASNRLNFTYEPQAAQGAQPPSGIREDTLTSAYLRKNGEWTDLTLASSYPNVASNSINVSNGRISRDTFLLGFSGHDTFFNTRVLKNGWTVKECLVLIHASMGSGAEVTECRQGTSSPFVKIRWYLEPTFVLPNELTYSVRLVLVGPVGTSFGYD
jgi:hypothetical protein